MTRAQDLDGDRASGAPPTVHRLLDHLRERGVDFLPRPLGVDEQGREVLTYLPGTVPTYPLPAHVWAPAVLATAGRQLAEVHAASVTFLTENDADTQGRGGGALWQQPPCEPVEVVCLNDVAPYDMVFDDAGQITGWIDVDTASPGPRVWDLAYLAYRLVPLTGEHDCGAGTPDPVRYRRRLAALCQACSTAGDEVGVSPAEVLAVLPARLLALAADADARLAAGADHLAGHGDLYRREIAWLAHHAEVLARPALADLVVVTGPIASGKSTTAAVLGAAATGRGRTAVVVDVDDVAETVAAPGAGAAGLWFSAHRSHGALGGPGRAGGHHPGQGPGRPHPRSLAPRGLPPRTARALPPPDHRRTPAQTFDTTATSPGAIADQVLAALDDR